MVTRTLTITKAICLCLDVTTVEPLNICVEISGVFKDEKKLLAKIKELKETDDLKVVKIVSVDAKEDIYGMTEQDFMANAIKLEPRKKEEKEKED